MRATIRMAGAILALAMLAACGAGQADEPQTPDDQPGPIQNPKPLPIVRPDPISTPSKKIVLSGVVQIIDGYAKANLDVALDGEWALDANVKLGGHELEFRTEKAGYHGEIAIGDLPADRPLVVEVVHGSARHTRSLLVPGEFELTSPDSVVVETDFAVSWSNSTNATGYRAYLKPEGGVWRGGELGVGAHEYTFNGLDSPGSADLVVSAVTQNLDGTEDSNVVVLRTDARTLKVVDEQRDVNIKVTGSGTIARYYSEFVLRVEVDGQEITDAQVFLGEREVSASQESGLYELYEFSTAPIFDAELRVVFGGQEVTRFLTAPGEFSLISPEAGAHPSGDKALQVEWTTSSNAQWYDVSVVSATHGSIHASTDELSTTIEPTGWTGYATLHMHAVSISEPAPELGRIQIRRTIERNLLFK